MQGKNPTHSQLNLTAWLTEKLITVSPQAAAESLQSLATHEAILLLKSLKAEQIIRCLNGMQAVKAAAILRRLPSRQAAYVLERLNVPLAAAVYQAFSVPQKEKMKVLLDRHILQAFEQAAGWPAGSAGAVMKRDFVSFKTETKMADILEKLKTWPRKKLPALCVIVGKEGELKGAITTAELVFCSANSLAGSVMSGIGSISAEHPAIEAVELLQKGQLLVPVVDKQQVVLGVIGWPELWKATKSKKHFFEKLFHK